MITDRQWEVFAQHVKPNSTVRYGKLGEGYLLENFPFAQDNARVDVERVVCLFYGFKLKDCGRLQSSPMDELRVQLCDDPREQFIDPLDLDFWLNGDFLTFEQVLALGDAS